MPDTTSHGSELWVDTSAVPPGEVIHEAQLHYRLPHSKHRHKSYYTAKVTDPMTRTHTYPYPDLPLCYRSTGSVARSWSGSGMRRGSGGSWRRWTRRPATPAGSSSTPPPSSTNVTLPNPFLPTQRWKAPLQGPQSLALEFVRQGRRGMKSLGAAAVLRRSRPFLVVSTGPSDRRRAKRSAAAPRGSYYYATTNETHPLVDHVQAFMVRGYQIRALFTS